MLAGHLLCKQTYEGSIPFASTLSQRRQHYAFVAELGIRAGLRNRSRKG